MAVPARAQRRRMPGAPGSSRANRAEAVKRTSNDRECRGLDGPGGRTEAGAAGELTRAKREVAAVVADSIETETGADAVVDTVKGSTREKCPRGPKRSSDVPLGGTGLTPQRSNSRPAETTKGDPATVLSLSAARARREQRRRARRRGSLPELQGIDLRGIDLDRLSPEAREHYWFNVNKYARHLFVSSCELSMDDCDHPHAPVCVQHVREAELNRMAMQSNRGDRGTFGLLFFMDGLQILGAAACGALATQPGLFGSAGMVPLAISILLTAGVFLFREAVAARAGRF